jgi:hypothetical protein
MCGIEHRGDLLGNDTNREHQASMRFRSGGVILEGRLLSSCTLVIQISSIESKRNISPFLCAVEYISPAHVIPKFVR